MEYAVYKGEDIICIGTAVTCAHHLGVTVKTIQWYATPTGQKRAASRKKPDKCLMVCKIEEE